MQNERRVDGRGQTEHATTTPVSTATWIPVLIQMENDFMTEARSDRPNDCRNMPATAGDQSAHFFF